jgi:predicted oxidoreductase
MKSYCIPRTDLQVSRIAFGCDRLVREGVSPDALSTDDVSQAARALNIAYENGITLFDTAEVYGLGSSEAALGRVLAQSPGLRNNIIIQSKCGILSGLSRADAVVGSVDGSLERLRTDRLDVLLLHHQDALVEPEEVARAFDDLEQSGKVRCFGVSNHTMSRIELLKRYVRQPLVIHQIPLGLAHSELLDELYFIDEGSFRRVGPYTATAGVDYCRLNDMQVQAYSPLRGKNVFGQAELLSPPAEAPTELQEAAKKLHELATEKKTTPAAIALAWLLRHPAGIVPIIGSKRAERIVEACAADRVELSREEWYALWWATRPSTS